MSRDKSKLVPSHLIKKNSSKSHERPFLLTLIIPVYNCSERIGFTLESIKAQGYPNLEVIVIDAGSTDHTLDVINLYSTYVSRIYSVSEYNFYEMVNRGIALANGKYISVLMPGSFYLSPLSLDTIMVEIQNHHYPALFYCGGIQRESRRESRMIFHPFSIKELKQGKMPTLLSAIFWRSDLFERIGKFNSRYPVRAPFDLLCRVVKSGKLSILDLDRIFLNYDYGTFSYTKFLQFAQETWRILSTHFGSVRALLWFLGISHWNVFQMFIRHLKKRFS